jgi:hypothetical protein
MIPHVVLRVGDYCENPQDIVTRDDLAAFLESEIGLACEDAQRLVAWLLVEGYLEPHRFSAYHADLGAVVDEVVLRRGPALAPALHLPGR